MHSRDKDNKISEKTKSNLQLNSLSTADDYLDKYYKHKQSIRRSSIPTIRNTSLNVLKNLKEESFQNEKNIDKSLLASYSITRSKSFDIKILSIKVENIFIRLLLDKNNKRLRRDYFGNIISKNGQHKVAFAKKESLNTTRKVASFSKITRKLNNENDKVDEGFCLLF